MLDGYDNVCTVKPVEQTDTLLLNAINSLRKEESECNCKCPPLSPRLWVACGGRLVCDFLAQLRQTACARCLRVNSGHGPSATRRGQRQARPGYRACHKRQVRVRSCRPRNAVPCPSKHEKREHFTYRIVSALTLVPCRVAPNRKKKMNTPSPLLRLPTVLKIDVELLLFFHFPPLTSTSRPDANIRNHIWK